MSRNGNCPHLDILQLSLSELYTVKQGHPCSQCDAKGRNLWICLYRTCMNIGCSEHDLDHGTKHFRANQAHCLQLNLSTRRIWCYLCNAEVFLQSPSAETSGGGGGGLLGVRRRLSSAPNGGGHNGMDSSDEDGRADADERDDAYADDRDDSEDDDDNDDGDDGDDDGPVSGLIGLKNIANTCYMNAALQALSNAPPLQGFFMDCGDIVEATGELQLQRQQHQHQHHHHYHQQPQQHPRKVGLARSYHRLVKDMWSRSRRTGSAGGAALFGGGGGSTGGGYLVPSGILNGIRSVQPMFRGYQQHDTQEFLRCFMDQLHEELKEPTPAPPDAYLRNEHQPEPQPHYHQPVQQQQQQPATNDAPDATYMDDRSQCSSPSQSLSEAEYETCDSGVSEQSSLSEEHIDTVQQQNRTQQPPRQRPQYQPPQRSPPSQSPTLSFRRFGSPTSNSNTYQRQHQYDDAGDSNANGNSNTTPNSPTNSHNNNNNNNNTNTDNANQTASNKPQSPPAQQRSIISDIFDGKLISAVQCLTCDRVSTREETFQDLSLPIPGKDHLSVLHQAQGGFHTPTSGSACSVPSSPILAPAGPPLGPKRTGSVTSLSSSTASFGAEAARQLAQAGWFWWIWNWIRSFFWGPAVSLYDCMSAFFSADELKGDNMYSCERCKKLRNGIKYSRVLQLPEMLCVHLKRFRHDLSYSSKIAAPVRFPLRGLDMAAYLHRDCRSAVTTYDLTAVICHHGTVGGGHYTSYARHSRNGRWYEYDDQLVTPVAEETVAQCEAYVLFYRKSNAHMVEVRQQAMELLDACAQAEFEANGGGGAAAVEERSAAAAAAAAAAHSDLRFFVSKQWLNRFNTFAEPGPIDNWALQCPHGALSPGKAPLHAQLVVALPQPLWEFLYARFGGGPVINHLFECDVCRRAAEALQRRQLAELAAFQQFKEVTTPTLYAISMVWLRQWQAFVAAGAAGDGGAFGEEALPPGPIANAAIANAGQADGGGEQQQQQQQQFKSLVLRSVRPGSDYAQVNSTLWRYFHGVYGGGPTIVLRGAPEEEQDDDRDGNGTAAAEQQPQQHEQRRVQPADDDVVMVQLSEKRVPPGPSAADFGDDDDTEDEVIVEISSTCSADGADAALAAGGATGGDTAARPRLTMRMRSTKVTKSVSFEDDNDNVEAPEAAVVPTVNGAVSLPVVAMMPQQPQAGSVDETFDTDSVASSSVMSNGSTASSIPVAVNGGNYANVTQQQQQPLQQQHQHHRRGKQQQPSDTILSKRDKRHRGGITTNGMFGAEGKYSSTVSAEAPVSVTHSDEPGTAASTGVVCNGIAAQPNGQATVLVLGNSNGSGEPEASHNAFTNNSGSSEHGNNVNTTTTTNHHVPMTTQSSRKAHKMRKKLKSAVSSSSRNKHHNNYHLAQANGQ